MPKALDLPGYEDIRTHVRGLSYYVPSSDGETVYIVNRFNKHCNDLHCNCPAGQHNKPCKHCKRVRAMLHQIRLEEAAARTPAVAVMDVEDEDPFADVAPAPKPMSDWERRIRRQNEMLAAA